MAGKREEVYSSLFDLIFSEDKSKGGNPLEGVDTSSLSGVGRGLAEMAAYPTVYPAKQLVNDFSFQTGLVTSVKLEPLPGFKMEVGAANALDFFLHPQSFIDAAWKDYKDAEKLARFSGQLKYIDGGKFAVQAHRLGMSWSDAIALGSTVQDSTGIDPRVIRGDPRATSGQVRDLTAKKVIPGRFDRISGGAKAGLGPGRTTSGTVSSMQRGINAEFDVAIKDLERMGGITLTPAQRSEVKADLSSFWQQTANIPDKANRKLRFRTLLDGYSKTFNGRTLYLFRSTKNSLESGIWGSGDHRDFGYFSPDIPAAAGEDFTARLRYASERSQVKKLDDLIAHTQDANLRRDLINYRNTFVDYITGKKVKLSYSLGTTFGRAFYINKWRKDNIGQGKLLGSLLVGGAFDFKNNIWKSGFADTFLSGYKDSFTGRYRFELGFAEGNRNNWVGKYVDAYYYWHPVNIAKGIFWDGRTFKKLNDWGLISNVDAERLIKFMPAQWLAKLQKGTVGKAFNSVVGGISYPMKGVLAHWAKKNLAEYAGREVADIVSKVALKDLLTKIIQKIVVQALGSVIPGIGNVAAVLADAVITLGWWMAEKVLKPLISFLILIGLGIISTIIIQGVGLFSFKGQTYTQPYVADPVDFHSGHLIYGPVDYDFPEDPDGGLGVNYPLYSGAELFYGGAVLSGSAYQIWEQAAAEFGVNASLVLVYPGSYWYDVAIGEAAWCFSASGTIYCKAAEISSAGSALLTGLFRHELVHQAQHANGGFSNWSQMRWREWGAEHLSGNGGYYMFSTSDAYCMNGLQVSQKLLDSGKCTKSQLDDAALGKSVDSSCASYIKSYITGATIGEDCN
jgi:hypothetical protein